MIWIDSKVMPPQDGEWVHVKRSGHYILAVYDEGRKRFRLIGGAVVKVGDEPVFWSSVKSTVKGV
jgi:hypothetical protein